MITSTKPGGLTEDERRELNSSVHIWPRVVDPAFRNGSFFRTVMTFLTKLQASDDALTALTERHAALLNAIDAVGEWPIITSGHCRDCGAREDRYGAVRHHDECRGVQIAALLESERTR